MHIIRIYAYIRYINIIYIYIELYGYIILIYIIIRFTITFYLGSLEFPWNFLRSTAP